MSQLSLTILVLTAHRLVRADFDSSGANFLGFWTSPRTQGSAPAEAVRNALALGGKAGRHVWVLWEDAWIQSVDLARGQVNGLSAEQIGRALSFEVEPFSGVPVGESAIGFHETDDRDGLKSYWIVEIPATARDAMQRAIVEAGGRLAGIGHPGGVPASLHPAAIGQGWQRLEAWNGGMVWLESDGKHGAHARVLTAAPLRPLPEGTGLELLTADRFAAVPNLDPDLPWERFFLDDEDHLRGWLTAWAGCLQAGRPAVPMVASPPPKPTPRKYVLTGVVLMAAVLALCFFDAWRSGRERDALKKQQAAITQANQQVQNVTKENTALRKEIADLDLLAEKRAQVAGRRGALPALLRALAENRPEDVVLSGIHPGGGVASLIVSGLALEAISVDEMSMILTQTLRSSGWYAQPLQKIAKRALPNAGPWEFSISVSQEEPTKKSSAPSLKRSR